MYNDEFYESQYQRSELSALSIITIINRHFELNSVIDVGCGRGSWLNAAYKVLGEEIELTGIDGIYNSEHFKNKNIKYIPSNLEEKIYPTEDNEKYDICFCLEVAEHLTANRAPSFIEELTDLSDIILFSAAIPNQGGTNHINENFQSYWADIFSTLDYYPFDIVRHEVWNNDEVDFWYRQNIIIYIKKNSYYYNLYSSKILTENFKNLNLVHPDCYINAVSKGKGLRWEIKKKLKGIL
jgi:cyclopropane fatty-acyl-phospholipid synthase-like methyltransferase